MLKRWCMYLAVLTGLLVLYLAYQQWLAWILLVGCLALPAFSLFVSLPAIFNTRLILGNGGGVPAGTEVSLRAAINCPFPVPIFRCPIRVTNVLTQESWLLRPGSPLPTEHCGMLWISPERCCVFDYFGLFLFPLRNVEPTAMLVRPVETDMDVPKELEQYLARSWRPKPGGGFSEHHELRLYRPGDSMNQVHWKLTAKTGKLIIREAMEPARGTVLLTLDLWGEPEELDGKMEELLFLGNHMLEQNLPFQLHAMTGQGHLQWQIWDTVSLEQALDELLGCDPAEDGSVSNLPIPALWQYHIGGEPDES